MKLIATLLLSITFLTAGDLPAYFDSNFDASKKNKWQLHRYIVSGNGPQIYVPQDTVEWKGYLNSKINRPKKSADGVTVYKVTNDGWANTETWMAVNPLNPKNIVATANDFSAAFGGKYAMVAHWSKDGGQTWNRTVTDNHNRDFIFPPASNGGATIFDPCINFTDNGDLVYLYGYAQTPANDADGWNGIFASISKDGGETWNQFNDISEVSIASFINGGLQDRYSTAVDLWSDDYKGNVYVAWKDFDDYNGIRVAATNKNQNEYKSWSPVGGTQVYNTLPGTQAPVPAVSKTGTVWLTFRRTISRDRTEAPLYYSTNGGQTFQAHSVPLNNFNIGASNSELELFERVNLPDKSGMRISTNPLMAVDNSNSEYAGTVYIVMPGKEGSVEGRTSLFVAYQRNANPDSGNEKWVTLRIDNNELGNDIFHPNITVDETTGYVHVMYYSSQNDPTNKGLDVYYAYSYDGGQTWKHKRLTDELSYVRASFQNFGNRYWGDYTSIVSYDNHIYPLWWVQTDPNSFHSNELYTAKLRTYPDKPAILESDFDGSNITISWDGIYDGLGEVIAEYDVKLFKDGQEISTFDMSTNSWIDQGVETGSTQKYGIQVISKDARGAGEVHNFEFIAGGAIETEAPTNFLAYSVEGGIELSFNAPLRSVDGQSLQLLETLSLYNGETKLSDFDISSFRPGDPLRIKFETENDQYFDNLYLTSSRSRDGQTEESVQSNSIMAFSGPAFEDMNVDFENITPNFVTTEGWAVTDAQAFSGDFSITDSPDGDYSGNANNEIIFMPFIYNSSNQYLNMQLIANVDSDDQFIIELSNDNGQNWRRVAITNQDFVPQWTGETETSEWFNFGIDLAAQSFNEGDNVYIRLILETNALKNLDGVYVDDIFINNILSVENGNEFVNKTINPNPAYIQTNIYFEQAYAGNVNLDLYSSTGGFIKNITNRYSEAGAFEHSFNVENLSSGMYYIRVQSNNSNFVMPLNVIR